MSSNITPHFDAIVIGAGFAGLMQLRQLRDDAGLRVRLFEKGEGIGGTWFWNKYPGAMSDTESPYYRYSGDKALLDESSWTRKYINQPEILKYLGDVANRYDLMRDIQLNTEVKSMVFDERASTWAVSTKDGETFTAKFLVTALGLLAAVNKPSIPGIDSFQGRLVHTAQWPDDLKVDGKRVGVIGTGSTGAQFICTASQTAKHLTVFQRSPQYSVPSGNGPVEDGEVDSYKSRFSEIFQQVRGSTVGFGFVESTIPAMSVSEAEREATYEAAWKRGNGFYFMFGTFCDIATDPEANETAAAFIRKKIGQIVEDPETARRLTPSGLYAKRPLCNHKYFEVYNQPNVTLVSVADDDTPIVSITPKGVMTADGVEHELDILVLATGFDAVDGNYRKLDLRGRGGQTIDANWQPSPKSYLGIATAGFPNMFMIMGPNGPFTNLVPAIEVQVEFVTMIVRNAVANNRDVVEITPETENSWTDMCVKIANATLFSKVESWIFGANIPGKAHSVLFYLGGLGNYLGILKQVQDDGFRAFAGEASQAKDVEAAGTQVSAVEVTS